MRIFAAVKPTISAVNGAAVGFGATVLLPTAIRLASPTRPSARRAGWAVGADDTCRRQVRDLGVVESEHLRE
jgi:hypothetical protein